MNTTIDAKYCTGCGAPIESMVRQNYCPYCGNKDEGKKFCAECGAALADMPKTAPGKQHPAASMAVQAAVSSQTSTVAAEQQTAQHEHEHEHETAQPTPQWGGGQQPTTAKLAKAYCPDCGNEATWIGQYNQWYCYVDQKYVATPSYTEPKKGMFKKR